MGELLHRHLWRPFLLRLDRDDDLHVVRVVGLALLRPPDRGEHRSGLRVAFPQHLAHAPRNAHRLLQRCGGNAGYAHHDLALGERGHEFLAEEGKRGERGGEHEERRADHGLAVAERPVEHRRIRPPDNAKQPRFGLGARPERERGEYRDEREAEQQRSRHGERDRVGHRLEELALQPGEREQRQEHDDDDHDREGDRLRHLDGRVKHNLRARGAVALVGQVPECVLHHHHRAVDHHADADRQARKRHQVRRHAEALHEDEGEQHRERQRRDDHQRGAQLAEEQERDDGDQDRALDERPASGVERLFDDSGAVVDRIDADPLRECPLRALQLLLDRLDHLLGVLADARERDAERHFLAVARHRAEARCCAFHDLGEVAHVDRRAFTRGDHHVAQVLRVAHPPQPAHQILLGAGGDELASDLPVVGVQRFHHFLEGHAVFHQPGRVDQHLELLLVSAPRGDVVDARRGAQRKAHGPVVQRAQLHRVQLLVGRFDRVPEDLAQAGAHRAEAGLAVALGNAPLRLGEALPHEPAREPIHRDVRQAEQRDRAHDFHAWQPRQRGLDRRCKQPLDILGCEARRLGVDVHLVGCHIRKRVHGHGRQRVHAETDEAGETDQHQKAVAQRY